MSIFASTKRTTENGAVRHSTHSRQHRENAAASFTAPSYALPVQRKASCACGGDCPSCATTGLKVSHPSDAAEIEADQVAEQVMRMSVQTPLPGYAAGIPVDSTIPKNEMNKGLVQRKAETGSNSGQDNFPRHFGAGQQLDRETRAFMEPRFGVDLGGVRLHTDTRAAESAREVDAMAFTVGQDIVFGSGQYSPATMAGKRLIAHELTHTIQQGLLARHADIPIKNAGEPLMPISRSVTPQIQRQPPGGSYHSPGGPYHPPKGTIKLKCTYNDSCPSLGRKISYLKHTIKSHIEWDIVNPRPGFPGGRHAQDIAEMQNGLANCLGHYTTRCTKQPQVRDIRLPAVDPATLQRIAAATAVGVGIGTVLGAIVGAVGGGAGGTLVAPGVGTIGGGIAGGVAGAAEGAAIGGVAGAAVMGGMQALWEWLND